MIAAPFRVVSLCCLVAAICPAPALAKSSPVPVPEGMVPVKGGTLMVGSTDRDIDRLGELYGNCDELHPQRALCDYRGWWLLEQPIHERRVRTFLLGRKEVTVRKWREFVRATGYRTTAERCAPCPYWYGPAGWERVPGLSWRQPTPGWTARSSEPVVQVTIPDVKAYMAWRSRRDGVRYRLPSLEELEWAAWGSARLAERRQRPLFPFAVGTLPRFANYADWTSGFPWSTGPADHFPGVAPVGSFPPNPYDLYDVLGNVWEWTNSQFLYYDYDEYRQRRTTESDLYEIRGGGFTARPGWMRPQTRMYHAREDAAHDIGFRLALSS